jgi:hypothetical protein
LFSGQPTASCPQHCRGALSDFFSSQSNGFQQPSNGFKKPLVTRWYVGYGSTAPGPSHETLYPFKSQLHKPLLSRSPEALRGSIPQPGMNDNQGARPQTAAICCATCALHGILLDVLVLFFLIIIKLFLSAALFLFYSLFFLRNGHFNQ